MFVGMHVINLPPFGCNIVDVALNHNHSVRCCNSVWVVDDDATLTTRYSCNGNGAEV